MKVFVYGTLKSGHGAEDLMWPGHVLYSKEVSGYRLYTNGGYPMAVPGQRSDRIVGELWEVPRDNLERLDSYEGHPYLFKREVVMDGEDEFYMYVYQSDPEQQGYTRLPDGVF